MTNRPSPAAPARTGIGTRFPTGGCSDGRQLAIDVEGLTKRFGDFVAVDGVTFSAAEGEVFAFLGPNGAGKSTTIKMLCTLARPSGGHALVAGYDVVTQPRAVRRHIGLVFQEQTLDDQLTAEENLRFHAVLYQVSRTEVDDRVASVLALVGLSERRRDLVSTFSGGMARRLEIARSLLHTPHVLFLDEPTLGLDPQTRALMWDDVLRLRNETGVTVFLTTHYMEEAEYADRIAIIDHGAIVALDSPKALKAKIGADTVQVITTDDELAVRALREARFDVHGAPGHIEVRVGDGDAAVAKVIDAIGVASVRSVHVHHPTLDDVFLHFTGREIRDRPGEGHHASARTRFAHRH